MERLASKYRDRIEAQKVYIWVEAQRRSAGEVEARNRATKMRRADVKRLESL